MTPRSYDVDREKPTDRNQEPTEASPPEHVLAQTAAGGWGREGWVTAARWGAGVLACGPLPRGLRSGVGFQTRGHVPYQPNCPAQTFETVAFSQRLGRGELPETDRPFGGCLGAVRGPFGAGANLASDRNVRTDTLSQRAGQRAPGSVCRLLFLWRRVSDTCTPLALRRAGPLGPWVLFPAETAALNPAFAPWKTCPPSSRESFTVQTLARAAAGVRGSGSPPTTGGGGGVAAGGRPETLARSPVHLGGPGSPRGLPGSRAWLGPGRAGSLTKGKGLS